MFYFGTDKIKAMEIFKDIKDYEAMYQVSNLGNVKSLARKSFTGKLLAERILKPSRGSHGYLTLSLRKNGKPKNRTVHQLVAEAFLGHLACGHAIEVDHIDEDKLNNRLDNLQLLSSAEHRGKGSSSKYTGVSWHNRDNKWTAQIMINGKKKYLGRFACELKAAYAYQTALNKLK